MNVVGATLSEVGDVILLGFLAALATGVAVTVYKGAQWLGRWFSKQVADSLKEAIVDAIGDTIRTQVASVVEDKVTPDLDKIRSELAYNGGRTVKDMVRWLVRESGGEPPPDHPAE